jgi:hypothetical protein
MNDGRRKGLRVNSENKPSAGVPSFAAGPSIPPVWRVVSIQIILTKNCAEPMA